MNIVRFRKNVHCSIAIQQLEDQLPAEEDSSDSISYEICRVLSECRAAHCRYRIREIPMVPKIPEVATKLKLHLFTQLDAFQETKIPLLETRPAESVSA